MQPDLQCRAARSLRRGLSQTHVTVLSMLAVAVLAGAIYGRALDYGFFNDDPTGHFRWMEGLSLFEPFVTSAGYGFYRPLTFFIWKVLHALAGGYSRPVFHALPIVLHMANTALLWRLAFSLSRRHAYAWVVALSFAAFPLSYEAVAYVAATFHPLLTFWLLVTLLLYRRALEKRTAAAFAASYGTMLLALFTHENGVVVPFLLAAYELLIGPGRSLRYLARGPLRWFFAAPALFIVLWLSVPKLAGSGSGAAGSIYAGSLPFLQVCIYPLLPALRLSAPDGLRLGALTLAALAFLYAVALLARERRVYAFALVWLALASLPSVLMLSPAYLYGSPRLYYLASAGAALLWGLPVLALERLLAGESVRRWALRGLQVLIALGMVLPSLPYVRCQLDFLRLASDLVGQMAVLARVAPPDREVVFVNVPFYFSSCQRYPTGCAKPYPIAPVGAVVIPPYADPRDLVRVNGGPERAVRAVTFAGYTPGWTTYGTGIDEAALRTLAREAQVYVFDLVTWSWFDLSSAWHMGGAAEGRSLATFGDVLRLEGVTWQGTAAGLEVVMEWRVLRKPEQPLKVFVHCYDPAGALATQHDGPPAAGYVPASLWEPGDLIRDRHLVPAPAQAPGGPLRLAVGLYDANSGARLTARSADGKALPDNLLAVGEVNWP